MADPVTFEDGTEVSREAFDRFVDGLIDLRSGNRYPATGPTMLAHKAKDPNFPMAPAVEIILKRYGLLQKDGTIEKDFGTLILMCYEGEPPNGAFSIRKLLSLMNT